MKIDIEPYIDELQKLPVEDRRVVLDYYSTWSEEEPAVFSDGNCMTNKIEDLFQVWLENRNPDSVDIDEVMDWSEEIIRDYVYCNWELDPQTIVNLHRGIGDHELFQDILDTYLANQE